MARRTSRRVGEIDDRRGARLRDERGQPIRHRFLEHAVVGASYLRRRSAVTFDGARELGIARHGRFDLRARDEVQLAIGVGHQRLVG